MEAYFLDEFDESECLSVLTSDGGRIAIFANGWVQEAWFNSRKRRNLGPSVFNVAPLRNVLSKNMEIEWNEGYWMKGLDAVNGEVVVDMEDGKLFRYGGLRRSWSETSKIDPKRQRRYKVEASSPANIADWLEENF